MRAQSDDWTGARQGEVGSVKSPDPYIVELLVVFGDQALAALVVLPNPLAKPFLDLLLLLAGGFRRRRIDNPLFGPGISVVNGRCPQIQGVFNEVDTSITRGTPLRRIAD